MLTLGQRRSWARHGARSIQATIDAALAEQAAERDVRHAEAIAAAKVRDAAVPYTAEQLATATHIRTGSGWHKVVRVNAKSVTTATGYSWTDRYTLAKVLEVRTIEVA